MDAYVKVSDLSPIKLYDVDETGTEVPVMAVPMGAVWSHETTNVTEVVRCRDCIHDGLTTCPLCYIEQRTLNFINHDPDFFCAHGERREE